MKIFKLWSYIALIAFLGLTFTACDDEDDPLTPGDTNKPVITSLSTNNANVGDTVTINGTDFGTADDNGSVHFGTVQAKGEVGASGSDYVSWTNTKIEVIVPMGAKSGELKVEKTIDGTVYTSEPIMFYVGAVLPAPTNLMARSENESSVALAWDKVEGASKYLVKYGDQEKEISATTEPQMATKITGLDEGTVYEFSVHTISADNNAGPAAKVSWAPAYRFESLDGTNTIKLYEAASSFGSGIDLYNDTDASPKILTVAESDNWNLGLYAKNNEVKFGSASKISFNWGGATPIASLISNVIALENVTLDDLYGSQAMDSQVTYTEELFDLTDATLQGKNILFFVKVPNGDKFNYAKVLVNGKGGFLKGTAPNRYVEVTISYQKAVNVPYAK